MLIKDAALIPDWLKAELEEDCPFCGAKYEIGYSPNGQRVTSHYCPNRECPATVATKMALMWDILGVDGIKYGKSMALVKSKGIKKHLDAIPYVIKEKPEIPVSTFMRINFIEGIDEAWNSICNDKTSLGEILSTREARKFIKHQELEDLKEGVKYFNLVFPAKMKYDPILSISVMMTGDIMGLPNREYLIHALNQKYKGLLRLGYSKSTRRTGMFALVKEEESAVTGKVRTAKECGIPIMTPNEFIIKIDEMIRERLGDKYDEYDV